MLDWTRAQIAVMRPDPHARAMRAVVADLVDTVAGTTYFVKRISGVWQRYDLPGEHPWVGASVPDLALADGTRLADHLHDGTGLLLDFGGVPPQVDSGVPPQVDSRVRTVRTVRAECPDEPELPGVLVRPDGFVAWAGGDGLDAALATWFG
ncbi:MAG TPA: hypothetical protein VGP26_27675 [Actinophytocola sp.]|nr:hypothetical protein [Actinophytocola sp.]